MLLQSVWPDLGLAQPEILRIQAVQYDAGNQAIQLVAQDGSVFQDNTQMVRLTQPHRVIVDIPNAILNTPLRSIPVHQNGLDRIELSQTFGTFYQVVRVTIYGDSDKALRNLQVTRSANVMKVLTENSPEAKAMLNRPPLPSSGKQFSFLDTPEAQSSAFSYQSGQQDTKPVQNHNVIQSVDFHDGILEIKAEQGDALIVKNQFTLTGPNRLVVDLANSVLAQKNLSEPIEVFDDQIKMIRLGQFEKDTVRVVVETARPNQISVIYPRGDKSTIALSNSSNYSVRTLPRNYQKIGMIDDINVIKKGKGSVVKIETSDPMVRRLTRRGDKIEVEFSNIAARSSYVAYDKSEFSDIESIRLTPLNAQEPNTRMIIDLKDNTGVDVESHVSMDGRTMEITLAPGPVVSENRYVGSESADMTPVPVSSVERGRFVVVVDAGHGGHDKGATREGIMEKNINLAVALKLKRALEARGIKVHMTRDTDKFIPLSGITGYTNRINPNAFVSVHSNASVNSAANGIETYYYTPQSRRLAQLVHRRMVNHVSSPDRGVRTAMFYVIHHTHVPAILCEIGYVSNPAERAALISESRQKATAEAIAQGVAEFLTQQYRAEAPDTNPEQKVLAD